MSLADIQAMKALKLAKQNNTQLTTDLTNNNQASIDFIKKQFLLSDTNLQTKINAIVDYINSGVSASNIIDTDLLKTNITTSFDGTNQLLGTKVSGTNTWVTVNKTQLNSEFIFTLTGATYFVLCANATKCVTVSLGCNTADFGWMTRWTTTTNAQVAPTFADTSAKGNVGDIVKVTRTSTGWKLQIMRSGQVSYVDWFNVAFQQSTSGTNLLTEFTDSEKQYGFMKYQATTNEVLGKALQYKVLGLTLPTTVSKWQGKIWNAIGDSITFFDQYEPLVSSSLGLASYRNYGKSGYSTIMLKDQVTTWDNNADLITFFAGTNDFGRCDTLQTTHNSVDYIFQQLLTKYPSKTIAVFLPLQRWGYTGDTYKGSQPTMTNSDGITLRQYCDTIKEVAMTYNLPVLDLYYMSGINKVNINTYSADGIHPNTVGYNLIAPIITDFLNSL